MYYKELSKIAGHVINAFHIGQFTEKELLEEIEKIKKLAHPEVKTSALDNMVSFQIKAHKKLKITEKDKQIDYKSIYLNSLK